MVWSICARFQLTSHDREDVRESEWLLLVEQLGKLREPAALPGWIATTTQRECLRVVMAARKSERLGTGLDDALQFVDHTIIDEEILMAERNAALRAACAELPTRCQQLLAMLTSDPPCSYAQISEGWGGDDLRAPWGGGWGAGQPARGWFVETEKNAYPWHNVKAAPAQLT